MLNEIPIASERDRDLSIIKNISCDKTASSIVAQTNVQRRVRARILIEKEEDKKKVESKDSPKNSELSLHLKGLFGDASEYSQNSSQRD